MPRGRWLLVAAKTRTSKGSTRRNYAGSSPPSSPREPKASSFDALFNDFLVARKWEIELRDEIRSLKCTPQGMRRLQDIAHNLVEVFNSNLQRRHNLNVKIIEGKGLDDISFLFSLVADRLLLSYLRPTRNSSEVMTLLRDGLEQFLELWNDLVKGRANIPKIFLITLMSEGIEEQQLWEDHLKKYDLVVAKAKEYKKQCVSHRTLIKSMTELRPELLSEAEYAYGRILPFLDNLINKKELKEMERKYGRPGGHAKRQSNVWLPIMKSLETELKSCFKSRRHWERPGGGSCSTAIPGEVYETINKILRFFYPLYWDLNPNTTASIKSRCQR
jgi:hypothetical protein